MERNHLLQLALQGLHPLHNGLLVALQQDHLFCSTKWQSWGYHSHAADLGAEKGHPDRSANARIARPPRPARFEGPARGHERPHHSPGPGPRSGPYQSQRPHQRPYAGPDRGQSFRPPHQHPHARGHAQHEHFEPWEDRRNRLNYSRQQPNWRPAPAGLSAAARRAERSEVTPPRLPASRSPAFGGSPNHHAPPRAHEPPVRLPHDTGAQWPRDMDRGNFRRPSDLPQQHLSAPVHQEQTGIVLAHAQMPERPVRAASAQLSWPHKLSALACKLRNFVRAMRIFCVSSQYV